MTDAGEGRRTRLDAVDRDSPSRRRRPERIGDLLPDAARRLGLDDELRLARAITTWDAIVAERVPPASGSCRLVRLEGDALVVEGDGAGTGSQPRPRGTEP